jgi:hypothetical protein
MQAYAMPGKQLRSRQPFRHVAQLPQELTPHCSFIGLTHNKWSISDEAQKRMRFSLASLSQSSNLRSDFTLVGISQSLCQPIPLDKESAHLKPAKDGIAILVDVLKHRVSRVAEWQPIIDYHLQGVRNYLFQLLVVYCL